MSLSTVKVVVFGLLVTEVDGVFVIVCSFPFSTQPFYLFVMQERINCVVMELPPLA